MRNRLFDDSMLPLRCPGCQHTTQQRISYLKTNPSVVCPQCRETIKVDASDLRGKLDEIQRQIEKMGFKNR